MKKLLFILLIMLSFVGFSQISTSNETKFITGTECIVFTFTNDTDNYQQKECVITYYVRVSGYLQRKVVRFRCNFTPNQIQRPNLTYVEGNPYVLPTKNLVKYEITFE
jgi:hypothetical protein